MGTKNNPGEFDCYAKADGDEPVFVLRAKDASAPYLVQAWAFLLQGKLTEAITAIESAAEDLEVQGRIGTRVEKIASALKCADAMADWAVEHDGSPRLPQHFPGWN